MKFLIDRCAGFRLAQWLRDQGHDVVESRERGADPGDRVLLQWATAEDGILITMDKDYRTKRPASRMWSASDVVLSGSPKDFGDLLYLKNAPHRGLIRLPDVPANQRIALMERLLVAHEHDLVQRAVITVRGGRVRISRKPQMDG